MTDKITLDQKTNEAFYHELTYYEPDGTTPKNITDIDIVIEIRDDNDLLVKRFSNIGNVASDLEKLTPLSGLYSISETQANVDGWKPCLAESDIIYTEDREDATETFNVNIIKGVSHA